MKSVNWTRYCCDVEWDPKCADEAVTELPRTMRMIEARPHRLDGRDYPPVQTIAPVSEIGIQYGRARRLEASGRGGGREAPVQHQMLEPSLTVAAGPRRRRRSPGISKPGVILGILIVLVAALLVGLALPAIDEKGGTGERKRPRLPRPRCRERPSSTGIPGAGRGGEFRSATAPAAGDPGFSRRPGSTIGVVDDGQATLDFLEPFAQGSGIASGDFDNDGLVDLAIADRDRVGLFRNLGDRSFGRVPLPRADRLGAKLIALVDIDDDGWLDLYLGALGDADYFVLNDRRGFADPKLVPVPHHGALFTEAASSSTSIATPTSTS